jgi:hypothetical protein
MPSSTILTPALRNTPLLSTSIKLTSPTAEGNSSLEDFHFALISSSLDGRINPWQSILKYGKLIISSEPSSRVEISWEESVLLSTALNANGRALLFTDLVAYCGKLYSPDKATGILYEVSHGHLIPRQILMSGDGMNADSFDSAWTATKNGILYIGSTGQASRLSLNSVSASVSQKAGWVTVVDPSGRVNHVNWEKEYIALCRAVPLAASLRHETALWSELKQVWIFLPTKELEDFKTPPVRPESANSTIAAASSSLCLLVATSDFRSIDFRPFEPLTLPNYTPLSPQTHTTTFQINSAKFLPNSGDEVLVGLLQVTETPLPLFSPEASKTFSRCFIIVFTLAAAITRPIIEVPTTAHSSPVTYTGIEFL